MGFNPLSTTKTERQWGETHWKKSENFTLTNYKSVGKRRKLSGIYFGKQKEKIR